mgnify:FL=1
MNKEQRKAYLDEYKRIQELQGLIKKEKGAQSNYLTKYKLKNAKTYIRNDKGKLVRWDDLTNAPYNEKALIKDFKLDYYGTNTPKKELTYLKAKTSLHTDKSNISPKEGLKIMFSPKLRDGGTVYEDEMKDRLSKEQERVDDLGRKLGVEPSTPKEGKQKKPKVFKLTESKQIDYTNLHPDNEHIKVLDKQIEEKKHQMMINLGNKL